MVRTGFGGGIGGTGIVRSHLGKVALGSQGTVHLIGGNVEKPEIFWFSVSVPVFEGCFQEYGCAQNIGVDEFQGTFNGAVHVGLGSEVDQNFR